MSKKPCITISAIFDTKFKKNYDVPSDKKIKTQFNRFIKEFSKYLSMSVNVKNHKLTSTSVTWNIIDTDKNPMDISRVLDQIKKDFSESETNHYFFEDSPLFFTIDTERAAIGRFILKSLKLSGGDKKLPRQEMLSPKELEAKRKTEVIKNRITDQITYADEIAKIKEQTDKAIIDKNITDLIDDGIPFFPKRQTIAMYRSFLKRVLSK